MPILDGMPTSQKEMQAIMEQAAPIYAKMESKYNFTPKQQSMIELVREGMSISDIIGLTKEEREAIFVQGCRLIQVGELQKAREVLTALYQLDPLDARVIYAVASIFQLQGDVARAAKLYVQFLALDATNAEGYLRLGECHLTAGETEAAAGLFRAAKGEAERGNGTPETKERAIQLLAHIEQRGAAAS